MLLSIKNVVVLSHDPTFIYQGDTFLDGIWYDAMLPMKINTATCMIDYFNDINNRVELKSSIDLVE